MAIIAKASSGGGGEAFAPAPAGMHRAICCDVVDLGMVTGQFGTKHKVRIIWQTEMCMPDGKPFMVDQRYTLSLDERSNLRKDLETWRGRQFTLEEAAGFDLERLIGTPCGLLVAHKPKTQRPGEVFANVQAVLPAMPGAPLKVRDYVRVVLRKAATNGHAAPTAPPSIGPSFAPPPTLSAPIAPRVLDGEPHVFDNDPFGHNEVPPITDADIPFAWMLPLMLPALGTIGAVLA
jgi:hypothetical protein